MLDKVTGFLKDKTETVVAISSLLRKLPVTLLVEIAKDLEAFYNSHTLADEVTIILDILSKLATISDSETDDQVVATLTTISKGRFFQGFLLMVERIMEAAPDAATAGDAAAAALAVATGAPAPATGFTPQSLQVLITPEEQIHYEMQSISIMVTAQIVSAVVSVLRYVHELRRDAQLTSSAAPTTTPAPA